MKKPTLYREEFSSLGEFLQAVANAGVYGLGAADRRLEVSAASGANESVPSEGGFLQMPEEFTADIWETAWSTGRLLSRTTKQLLTRRDGIKLPAVDEASRATGSRYGGLRMYWANEAATVSATTPKFRSIDLNLNKLLGLVYASDELLADAPALGSFLRRAFAIEAAFTVENTIINGTGAGQMLGVLNSGALVTITPQSPQSAGVLLTQDVLNMIGRLPGGSFGNAAWLVNSDVLPQLYQLVLGSGTSVIPLYSPPRPGDGSAGYLVGIPIIPCEYCATLGTVGDIVLADLSQYLVAEQEPDLISSIDVKFLTDESIFKFRWRIDGEPAWTSPIVPKNGTATVSPFIALGSRG